MMVIDKDVIVVWFSCGAASAVAAIKTLELYGDRCIVKIVNNPVIEEDCDNLRFLKDIESYLNVKIESAINPKFPSCSAVDVWNKKRFMSSVYGAPCTLELKKMARRYYEENNKIDWHVLGFTIDEKSRSNNFKLYERSNLLPILIDLNLTKTDCYNYLKSLGIKLPKMYDLGYPNANCIGCVKATSPSYWNHVKTVHPEIFNSRAIQSRNIGAKLVRVKGKRIFLDELDSNVKGRPMKHMTIDCGIFCEERSVA